MPGRILSDADRDDLELSYITRTATGPLAEHYNEQQQADLDALRTQALSNEQRAASVHFETEPMNDGMRNLFDRAVYAAYEFNASRAALADIPSAHGNDEAHLEASKRHQDATTEWIRAGTEFCDAVHDALDTRDNIVWEMIRSLTPQSETESLPAQEEQIPADAQVLNGNIAQVLNGNGAQRPNGNDARADATPRRPHNPQNGTGQQRRRSR